MTQTIHAYKNTDGQLDRERIEMSGLFDRQFYLSKYPDIKKSNTDALDHFVQHGAREYRWPNKNFDPLYYLKLVPQAYGENFLIHYLRLGQSWNIPTCARQSVNDWHIRKIAVQACRVLLFFWLCLIYSLERYKFSNFKFFRLAVVRFWQGCGSQVKLTAPYYLTQPKRLEEPASYQKRIFQKPIAFAYLYLANVLKIQGFFAEAQFLLNRLIEHSNIADLALCSLGDLLLVQAIWANEFKHYESEGIVLNLFEHTWHDCIFEQALTVIRKALDANPQNTDAQWLLGYGLLTAGTYADAAQFFDNYPGKDAEFIERKFLAARAIYGLDRGQGVGALHQFLKSDSSSWNISDLEIVNTANIPKALLRDQIRVLEPMKLPIESKTVSNLELITSKNILEFGESYVSRFKSAEILPEYGVVTVDNKFFIKESCHVKPCHASLFNSCIQEITDNGVFISTNNAKLFGEENCIYIGHNKNYYHWLIDELPRLGLIEAANLFTGSPILIDKTIASWQYELLLMMDIDIDRLRKVDFKQPIAFNNLIVPSRLSRDMVAHPAAVSYMRKKLLSKPDELKPTKGKRIYVTRTANTSTGRMMLNENNIINKFRKNNFQIVDPTQLSIKQQIELFNDADVIAGPVGAALTNILFAPKRARILSLGPDQFICETYTSIACAIGQESWSARGTSYARPYPYLIWTNFDYEINEKDIDFYFEHSLD